MMVVLIGCVEQPMKTGCIHYWNAMDFPAR